MTVSDIAKGCNVTRATVYHWIHKGEIESTEIDGVTYGYFEGGFDHWLKKEATVRYSPARSSDG